MDMKQVVAGAQGQPMAGGMDGDHAAKMAQAVDLLNQVITLISGGEQGEDAGKQAGFESVDKGMMG